MFLQQFWKKTLAAVLISGALVQGGQACEGLREGPAGRVVAVVDGDTVILDNDLKVRLIGIQAPKLPLGREGFEPWPLADEARDFLEKLVLGQRVQVRYGGQTRDRHGRVLGHVYGEAGEIWAQGEMLEAGLARVYSFADNRFCLSELLEIEARARAERVGIWDGIAYYRVRSAQRPRAIEQRLDSYEIVEGRVFNAARVGQRVYLNFGDYWKEDFTVVIERPALRLFERAQLDPLDLQDALVRVRGWVELRDGPRIEVTHPEQIEILARSR